jgi:glycerophosphoryl diester phosphodiesterase
MLIDAGRDFLRSWKDLALTDLAYKAIAFAILTPATALLLRRLMSGGEGRVIADAEILRYFVTTKPGVLSLFVGGSVLLAITALEIACLAAIGLSSARGLRLDPGGALAFGASRVANVLALTGHMVLRLLAGLVPFLLLGAAVYRALLAEHDINYYLAERPPEFWIAAVLAGGLVAGLATLLVWTIARWIFALPLVLFEGVLPRHALRVSARRSSGRRWGVLAALAAWTAFASVLAFAARWLPEHVGRAIAPHVSGSLATLILFITVLALFCGLVALVAAVASASLLALILVRLYLALGEPCEPRIVETRDGRRLPRPVRIAAAVVAALSLVGVVLLGVVVARRNQPVLVIAHRGASAVAPENTLAAFRLAVEQGADFVELDVQESADGEVLVIHDADLMKVGGSPLKVWETAAATLRSIDVGSHKGARYAGERVPTLAEALTVLKGRSKVIIELKSYGHDERLEERVAGIVEAAGMEGDCVTMSLDHDMVRTMKRIRPAWRSGVLVAKAIGDLTGLGADFLAVEARMASRRFVRKAHRAGQDVFVWTVNDPAWMLAAMSSGVDGLITDHPDVAREAVAKRAGMSDAQRVLVALLVRLGARAESLETEGALRP